MQTPAFRLLQTPPFCVGAWCFRPALLRAARGAEEVQIEPKVMGVLCCLAEHAGEPVTRDALFEEVWAGTVVSDDVLTRCISELRKLFGDTARAQQVIETLPRVGYRLKVPVRWQTAEPAGPVPRLASAVPKHSNGGAEPQASNAKYGWLLGGLAVVLTAAVFGLRPPAADAPALRPLAVTPLTATPAREMMARLSPDGRRAVYVRQDEGQPRLFVQAVEGGEALPITNGEQAALRPAWHPQGDRVAFVQLGPNRCEIAQVAAVGGPVEVLMPCPGEKLSCTNNTCPTIDWSPDGQTLASVIYAADGTSALALLEVATGAVQPLTYARAPQDQDQFPLFSPAGERLLFSRVLPEGRAALLTLHLATQTLTQLAVFDGVLAGYTWRDADTALVAVLEDGQQTILYTVPTDGQHPPAWLPLTRPGYRPDVRADQLILEQAKMAAGLYMWAPGAPALTPLAGSTGIDYFPSVAPDGQRLAFLSDRGGTYQVWVSDAAGQQARVVSDTLHVANTAPRWSPDGSRLAFVAFVAGQLDVFIWDALAQSPRRLAVPGSDERRLSWSPDGQWLYLHSDRAAGDAIWRIGANGDGLTRVTEDGVMMAMPSPDGQWLYSFRTREPGLWRRPLDGGADTLIFPGLGWPGCWAWRPVDDGVYLVDYQAAVGAALVHVGLEAQTTVLATGLEPALGFFGLSVAPDGRVFLGRIDRHEVDLLLADLSQF